MGHKESDTTEQAHMHSTIWWLNLRMWNLTYGEPTVKLYLDFWLFRGLIPPTPSLLKDQLYLRSWDFMRPRGMFRSPRSKMLAQRDLARAWRVRGAWRSLSGSYPDSRSLTGSRYWLNCNLCILAEGKLKSCWYNPDGHVDYNKWGRPSNKGK